MEGSQTVSWHCSFPKAGLKKQKEIAHQFYFCYHSIHASLPNGSFTGGWAHRSPESTARNQLASAPVPRVHSLHRQQVETRTKLTHSGIVYCAASFGGTGRERVGPPWGCHPQARVGKPAGGCWQLSSPGRIHLPLRVGLPQFAAPELSQWDIFTWCFLTSAFLDSSKRGEWQEHLHQLLHISFFLKRWWSACIFFALLPFALSGITQSIWFQPK